MIFLDNASTTRVRKETLERIEWAASEVFYNPSALYGEALKAKNAVEESRGELCSMLGCEKNELFFTSCATESNNWAYEKGIKSKKGNIVVSCGEHASGYECAIAQRNKGLEVRFCKLNADGTVNEDELLSLVDENTCFASVIHVSNETGAINDIARISRKIKSVNKSTIVHSDGVQAFVKCKTNMSELGVDLYAVSAHKVGGLKGVGALYVKGGRLGPLILGGGQERGMRSGTENVAGILAFAKAAQIYRESYDSKKIALMRNLMIRELDGLGVMVNGSGCEAILSLSIPGIKAEVLSHMLSDRGVLIGLGSACSSRAKNNRVLTALGRSPKEIEGSIRISFGIENDLDEVAFAARLIREDIITLRGNING